MENPESILEKIIEANFSIDLSFERYGTTVICNEFEDWSEAHRFSTVTGLPLSIFYCKIVRGKRKCFVLETVAKEPFQYVTKPFTSWKENIVIVGKPSKKWFMQNVLSPIVSQCSSPRVAGHFADMMEEYLEDALSAGKNDAVIFDIKRQEVLTYAANPSSMEIDVDGKKVWAHVGVIVPQQVYDLPRFRAEIFEV